MPMQLWKADHIDILNVMTKCISSAGPTEAIHIFEDILQACQYP